MDIACELLPGFLLRTYGCSWHSYPTLIAAPQLVSSATTAEGNDNAFFWLSKGAGVQVFEAFLKVTWIVVRKVCVLTRRLAAVHRPHFRHRRVFAWQPSPRFEVDLRVLHGVVWSL